MLIEPLVFNGNRSIDQILRNFIQRCGLTVCRRINLLQKLNISAVIHIINERGLVHIIAVNGPVGRLRKNIVLKVYPQCAYKYHTADHNDQCHRKCRTKSDFKNGKGRREQSIQQFDQPMRIPLLSGLFYPLSVLLFICHIITSESPETWG